MPDTAEQLRECHRELRTLSLGGSGHLADTCLTAAQELEQVTDAAERALEFLRDFHCDNQREVIDQLWEALR